MRLGKRGVSQVLFGYLPDQTVDWGGSIWKVSRWAEPRHLNVDQKSLAEELTRVTYPWKNRGKDGGLHEQLQRGESISVVAATERGGVELDEFPEVYKCNACFRVSRSRHASASVEKRPGASFLSSRTMTAESWTLRKCRGARTMTRAECTYQAALRSATSGSTVPPVVGH